MTPEEIKQQMIEEFRMFDDWMDRYDLLIEMGKALPPLESKFRINEFAIKGCQSNVWLHAFVKEGKMHFEADSDAIITKGLIALLIKPYEGQPAAIVENADMTFVKEIGLSEQLTPTRSNGLVAMIKQMKAYAKAYNTDVLK